MENKIKIIDAINIVIFFIDNSVDSFVNITKNQPKNREVMNAKKKVPKPVSRSTFINSPRVNA